MLISLFLKENLRTTLKTILINYILCREIECERPLNESLFRDFILYMLRKSDPFSAHNVSIMNDGGTFFCNFENFFPTKHIYFCLQSTFTFCLQAFLNQFASKNDQFCTTFLGHIQCFLAKKKITLLNRDS